MTQDLKQIVEKEAERVFPNWTGVGSAYRHGFIKGASFALTLNRWVKIEEGCEMPTQGQRVYVCQDGERQVAGHYIDGEFVVLGSINIVGVTHWMPQLPPPPVQP